LLPNPVLSPLPPPFHKAQKKDRISKVNQVVPCMKRKAQTEKGNGAAAGDGHIDCGANDQGQQVVQWLFHLSQEPTLLKNLSAEILENLPVHSWLAGQFRHHERDHHERPVVGFEEKQKGEGQSQPSAPIAPRLLNGDHITKHDKEGKKGAKTFQHDIGGES